MYYAVIRFSLCHGVWPFYGDCPLLGKSVMRGSTVMHKVINTYIMHMIVEFINLF